VDFGHIVSVALRQLHVSCESVLMQVEVCLWVSANREMPNVLA